MNRKKEKEKRKKCPKNIRTKIQTVYYSYTIADQPDKMIIIVYEIVATDREERREI